MREVFCEDAIAWLNKNQISDGNSLIASMPDISEFHGMSLVEWKQ